MLCFLTGGGSLELSYWLFINVDGDKYPSGELWSSELSDLEIISVDYLLVVRFRKNEFAQIQRKVQQ